MGGAPHHDCADVRSIEDPPIQHVCEQARRLMPGPCILQSKRHQGAARQVLARSRTMLNMIMDESEYCKQWTAVRMRHAAMD